jgi:hypothetical protein
MYHIFSHKIVFPGPSPLTQVAHDTDMKLKIELGNGVR